MLDTLLQIGKTLRNSETGKIRHHRYIKSAPLPDKKTQIVYWSVPVSEDFEIQFNQKSELINQNQIKNSLFYLGFKSGEADSLVKYIFGDISYGRDKNGKELGYYRMKNEAIKNAFGLSSFVRGIEDAKFFDGTMIEKFRKSFEQNIDEIEGFLEEQAKEHLVFLHFDFGGKSWYEFEDELKEVNRKLLEDFLAKQKDFFVLRKYIYKTLISSSSSLPSFNPANAYKTRAFETQDEVMNLLYSLDYSKKALVSERDIKVIVLPKGEHLEAKHIEDFFERGREDEAQATDLLNIANQEKSEIEDDGFSESLFKPVLDKVDKSITQYDFIFSKKGGASTPDVDMLELSGIERSFLSQLNERIRQIKQSELLQERTKNYEGKKIPKQFVGYDIRRSFLNILGDVTTDKKKYQSHLFKVLPQIYAGNYFRDDVILPAFIEKVEFNIRSDASNYNLLKYDYYFLVKIRNKNGEKDMEDMKKSESYQAGLLLGKMAKAIGRGREPKIKSFEKNYVGLLSRRITDKQGLIKLANFINEKLAIHNAAYTDLKQASVSLAQLVGDMSEKEYRKNYCAFGFFESYFGYQESENTEAQQTSETEN
ncbi:MAG: hypothetical protein M3388_17650 [Acidobacteriota bacterium]|nr:hypothetical protein [Acidobacteriota bacterium]